MLDVTDKRYNDERAARRYLEKVRWPDGKPECPHCDEKRAHRLKGKTTRPGLWFCGACRKQFTVTVGTLFERSKIPLHKWVMANHLICASKKGMSAHQLHRMLGVTYKTAWFMAHRIREAMRDKNPEPMGGGGKAVEADETYFGGRKRRMKRPDGKQYGLGDKMKIVALVERGGRARSFHVDRVNSKTIRDILVKNVRRDSVLMTDEAKQYRVVGKEFSGHKRVYHSIYEYVRGEAHTNTIEGYFSIFKRGMKGVYQHCSEGHLHRYLSEFDFRYNTRDLEDHERAGKALRGIEGRRLTYGGSQIRSHVAA